MFEAHEKTASKWTSELCSCTNVIHVHETNVHTYSVVTKRTPFLETAVILFIICFYRSGSYKNKIQLFNLWKGVSLMIATQDGEIIG